MTENIRRKSYFDGSTLGLVGMRILTGIIAVATLGIGFPWAMCMLAKWEASHTVINGRRLKFTGTGGELFVKYILWNILTCITCGIYSFWLGFNLEKWRVKHLVYEDDNSGIESKFDAGVVDWIINHIGFFVLSVITFGIALPWAERNLIKWKMEHTQIGGDVLTFTGTGGKLFVMYLLLGLLSGITCGIYSIFFPVKYMKWHAEHTVVWRKAEPEIAANIPNEEGRCNGAIIGVIIAVIVIAVVGITLIFSNIGFIMPKESSVPTEAYSEYGDGYGVVVEENEEIPELTEERAWELAGRANLYNTLMYYYLRELGFYTPLASDSEIDNLGVDYVRCNFEGKVYDPESGDDINIFWYWYGVEGVETENDLLNLLSKDFTDEYIASRSTWDYTEHEGKLYFMPTYEGGWYTLIRETFTIERKAEGRYLLTARGDAPVEDINAPEYKDRFYEYFEVVYSDGAYKIDKHTNT